MSYQQQIEKIPNKSLASQIDQFFPKWSRLPSDDAKTLLGNAIIKRVQDIGIESGMVGKQWYKVLKAFLAGK